MRRLWSAGVVRLTNSRQLAGRDRRGNVAEHKDSPSHGIASYASESAYIYIRRRGRLTRQPAQQRQKASSSGSLFIGFAPGRPQRQPTSWITSGRPSQRVSPVICGHREGPALDQNVLVVGGGGGEEGLGVAAPGGKVAKCRARPAILLGARLAHRRWGFGWTAMPLPKAGWGTSWARSGIGKTT